MINIYSLMIQSATSASHAHLGCVPDHTWFDWQVLETDPPVKL